MTNIVKLSSDYKTLRDSSIKKEEKEEKEEKIKEKEEIYKEYLSCTDNLGIYSNKCSEILISFYKR